MVWAPSERARAHTQYPRTSHVRQEVPRNRGKGWLDTFRRKKSTDERRGRKSRSPTRRDRVVVAVVAVSRVGNGFHAALYSRAAKFGRGGVAVLLKDPTGGGGPVGTAVPRTTATATTSRESASKSKEGGERSAVAKDDHIPQSTAQTAITARK